MITVFALDGPREELSTFIVRYANLNCHHTVRIKPQKAMLMGST